MSLPKFTDLLNEYNRTEQNKHYTDKLYIDIAIHEHYVDEARKAVYDNVETIVKDRAIFNIKIRDTDLTKIHYPLSLCSQINHLFSQHGYNFRAIYEITPGMNNPDIHTCKFRWY